MEQHVRKALDAVIVSTLEMNNSIAEHAALCLRARCFMQDLDSKSVYEARRYLSQGLNPTFVNELLLVQKLIKEI